MQEITADHTSGSPEAYQTIPPKGAAADAAAPSAAIGEKNPTATSPAEAGDEGTAVFTPTRSFHGFYGQAKVVQRVKKQLEGAKTKELLIPAILLFGSSGMGKTKLAESIAKEIGTDFHQFIAGREVRAGVIRRKIEQCQYGDVLFIDEAHALQVEAQECLLEAIDSGAKQIKPNPLTVASTADSLPPAVTFIFATDQPGHLVNALFQRCSLRCQLTAYDLNDLKTIGSGIAYELNILIKPQALGKLAQIAEGNARKLRHHITALHRQHPTGQSVTLPDVRKYLEDQGYDENDNCEEVQKYLRILGEQNYASVSTLAKQLDVDSVYISKHIEPSLISRGYINILNQGRTITDAGRALLPARLVQRIS